MRRLALTGVYFSPPWLSGRNALRVKWRRSTQYARKIANAAPKPSTASSAGPLDDHAEEQVADRHGATEDHETRAA